MSPLERVRRELESPTGVVRGRDLVRGRAGGPGALTDEALEWRVTSGRWQRLHPGVYLRRSGDVAWPTRAAAALVSVGPGAALCGPSAAHLHELGDEPGDVHLLVPASARPLPRPGVQVVRSDEPRVLDRCPRLTTYDSTVVDLTAGLEVDAVAALLAQALSSRRTTAPRLRAELERRRRLRGRGLALEMLTEVAAGSESPLEVRYVRDVERAHGLPRGTAQFPEDLVTIEAPGRRFDRAYPELGVAVELDGLAFHGPTRHRIDRAKQNSVAGTRWSLLRYGWQECAGDPCGTARSAAHVFRLCGWTGTPRRCPRCR